MQTNLHPNLGLYPHFVAQKGPVLLVQIPSKHLATGPIIHPVEDAGHIHLAACDTLDVPGALHCCMGSNQDVVLLRNPYQESESEGFKPQICFL